jgi:hypothetical protein
MNRAEFIPVLVVSSLLFVYVVSLIWFKASFFSAIIFTLSPLLVIWLVYSIVRHGEYNGKELKADEEFGYADKF